MTRQITPERVRNIILGATMAGKNVESIEVDGIKVVLSGGLNSTNPADLVDMKS
jgi:hypothetical protein